jgi:hypothetical protein
VSDQAGEAVRGGGSSADHKQISVDFSGNSQQLGDRVARSVDDSKFEIGCLLPQFGDQVIDLTPDGQVRVRVAACGQASGRAQPCHETRCGGTDENGNDLAT